MKRKAKRASRKMGLAPGTIVPITTTAEGPVRLTVITYDGSGLEEREFQSLDQALALRSPGKIFWLNIDGLYDVSLIERIGSTFGLHVLALEDLVNTELRPKADDHGAYIVAVMRMLYPAQDGRARGRRRTLEDRVTFEHVGIVLGADFVLTFQQHAGIDVFDHVRARIRAGKGRLRTSGADYLALSLIDAIVDGYFVVLEELAEELEHVEERVTEHPEQATLKEVHQLRSFALSLRRVIWPVREIISTLDRDQNPLVAEPNRLFLRDLYGHAVEVMDILEGYREMVAGLMELFLTSSSNRLNSVMIVLTIATVVFMPLTFIAGIYGMNFDYMPELRHPYGYPVVLAAMAVVAGGMLAFFRTKRWI